MYQDLRYAVEWSSQLCSSWDYCTILLYSYETMYVIDYVEAKVVKRVDMLNHN